MRISDWSSDVCSSDLDRLGSGRRGGAQWDTLMRNARQQAENYARRMPAEEGWPTFLAIVDVGHVIELFADFSLQGKHYAQFPDLIGRASCREKVCQYVYIPVVGGPLNNNINQNKQFI